ncbi:hypothetical protein PQR37_40755 [Paraburkholderia nemoris]|uniref:hypothetical protein n=1 Tax=Paraburkholderia nemoris TaxID=2793076 RepID=UPI0038B7E71B
MSLINAFGIGDDATRRGHCASCVVTARDGFSETAFRLDNTDYYAALERSRSFFGDFFAIWSPIDAV